MAEIPRSGAAERLVTALTVVRVFLGLVFLANGVAKLLPAVAQTPFGYLIGTDGALAVLRTELATHPVAPYRDFMEALFVANWSVAGPALGLFEVIVGAMLVAGLATRVAALAGALFGLHLHFLTLHSNHWLFEYPLLWLPLLAVAAIDGRLLPGVDAWRSRRAATAGTPQTPA